MNKIKLSIIALACCFIASAQNNFNQYSLEAGYGFNYARNPTLSGLNHFDAGIRYMQNEYWGAKADYGYDSFKSDNGLNTSTALNRISVQVVYNAGRLLHINDIAKRMFNLLLHSGAGITFIDAPDAKPDRAGNFIVGGTGQLYLSEDFALTGDLSGILNFSQNHNHNGELKNQAFTGKVLTFSIGITYYVGRNKSTSDWR